MTKEEFLSVFSVQQKTEMAKALLIGIYDNTIGMRERIMSCTQPVRKNAADIELLQTKRLLH